MMEPSLPVEILHLIFKDLDSSNDQQTLKACSLVSYLFLVLCRQYLFSSVTIFVTPDTKDADDKDQKIGSAVQFLSFLATDDHISSFIQSLTIRNNTGVPVSSTWMTVAKSLNDLLPKLSLLTSLSIHGNLIVDWTLFDITLRNVLMRLCLQPTLKTLDLSFMGISQQELLSFIVITNLSLTCIHLNRGILDPVPSKNLTSPTNNESRLYTLSVVVGDLQVSQAMWSLVKACANTLKSLKWMSSQYHRHHEVFLHFIDLRILPILTSLTICIPLRGESSLRDLIVLLGKSPERSSLEILEIVCDYDHLPGPGSAQTGSTIWQELDHILTSPALSALQIIKISFKEVIRPKHILLNRDNKAHAKEVVELFQNNLPNAYARGLIYGDQ